MLAEADSAETMPGPAQLSWSRWAVVGFVLLALIAAAGVAMARVEEAGSECYRGQRADCAGSATVRE